MKNCCMMEEEHSDCILQQYINIYNNTYKIHIFINRINYFKTILTNLILNFNKQYSILETVTGFIILRQLLRISNQLKSLKT